MENQPTRVLIIDTAWLGDVLFSTALIGAVRERWPAAELHLLTAPRARDLVTHHPELTRVWIYDKQGTERGMRALRGLARQFNAIGFELCLCAHPSFRSRLLCSLLNAPTKVGHAGFCATRAFTHVVHNDLSVEPDHVARRLNLLRAVTDVRNVPPLRVGISEPASRWAEERLHAWQFPSTHVLALIPGSARRTKQWAAENFRLLAQHWCERGSERRTLVILGPKEGELRPYFADLPADKVMIVEESLERCAALLSRCRVAVGNDTGVSFLAIAARCPQVLVLYGSTQVNYTFPPPHKALSAGVPCCQPRTGHGVAECRWTEGAPWCMSQIHFADVLLEIEQGQ